MTQRYLSGRLANTAAVALLALGIPSLAGGAQKETERVEKTIQFASGGTLKLKNFSGSVEITGEQRSDIALIAVRTAPRDRLDHIKLDIQSSGDTVTIDANKKDDSWHEENDNVVETAFTLRVPATANLDIDVFSAPASPVVAGELNTWVVRVANGGQRPASFGTGQEIFYANLFAAWGGAPSVVVSSPARSRCIASATVAAPRP